MLVGRDVEIAELNEALDKALDGTSRAAVVTGPAGIGKSALVEEVARHAHDQGVAVHWARCVEIGGAPAYWPWTQLVRSVLASTDRLALEGAASDAVSILTPDRSDTTSPARLAPVDSDEGRFRLFDGVAQLFEAAARHTPQLFIVEDCHVADAASLELLRFLVARPGRAPSLTLATHRHEGAPGQLDLLREIDSAAVSVALEGIDLRSVGDLVAAQLGRRPNDRAVSALRDATGGNPLFAKALARQLSRDGSLDHFGEGAALPVPGTVRDLFARRLSHLPARVATGLALLAAAGREVDPRLGRLLLGESFDDVVAAGIAEGHLERGAAATRFAHALVRAALLDALPPSERRDVHRMVGEALESLGADELDRLAALAHHFAEAGTPMATKAFEYARAAGEQARRIGAYSDAAAHYERALSTGVGDERARAEVLAALGDAEIRAGSFDRGRQRCREAWELARDAGLPILMAEAALAYSRFAEGGVVNEEVIRLVTGALAEIGDREPGVRARLRGRLASELVHAAADNTREALAREAAAEALATGDPRVVLITLRFAQSALSMPDNLDTCIEWTTAAADAADEVGDVTAKAEAIAYRSVHSLALGDVSGFGGDVATIAQIAKAVPTPLTEWHVTVAGGCRALLDGRFDDASAHIAASLAFASSIPNALGSWQFQDFSLAWERGDLARLMPVLNALVELRPGIAVMARAAVVMTAAACGELAEADAMVTEIAREVTSRRIPWVWLLSVAWCAEAASVVGNKEAARLLHDALAPFEDLHVVGGTGTVAAYWGSVRRYLANLSLTLGDTEGAIRHAEAALAAHARVGSAPFVTRSQYELGRALAAGGGDALRIESLVTGARESAERIGMTALLAAIDRERLPRSAEARAPVTGPRLVREGDYWTLASGHAVVRLRDTKGVRYLATLLRDPGREVHALDLVGGRDDQGRRMDDGAGDDVLDAKAKAEYRRRLQELEEEIAEADRRSDLGASFRLHEEWDFLVEELKRATGIGATSRTLGSQRAEVARVAATKAIRGVLRKIESADAGLGRHFRATVRTGTYCAYSSDLEPCLEWLVLDGTS